MKKSTKLLGILFLGLTGSLSSQTTVNYNFTGALQTFTVPSCVTTITIQAKGGQGGYTDYSGGQVGGLGADITGTFSVTPGHVLSIISGGMGALLTSGSGGNVLSAGGGGGSFVWDQTGNVLLIAAGGGGGSNSCSFTPGGPGLATLGGTGLGGTTYCGGSCDNSLGVGGGGAGWNGNGAPCGSCPASMSPLNGGAGGVPCLNITPWFGGSGGYGGGGQGDGNCGGGGGGGGYTGGNGGGNTILCPSSFSLGGTSYNTGSSQTNTGGSNSGNGSVILTYTPGITGNPISGPASLCANTTGTYTMPPVVGATNYTWTAQAGLTITAGQGTNTVTVSCVTSGTITCVADNGSCFSLPMTYTITVNPAPTVTANSTASAVCAGDVVTLTGGGATSYTWDNSVTDGVAFAPIATTTYMVTGTGPGGCTNTATISVTVNPLPTVVANSTSSSVCMGDMVTLTGGGATSYTWNNSVMDGVAFAPTATTTYMVTGIGANGCTNTATVTVTVNPLPTVVANSTASSVCMGDMVTLTGSGATTYTWDNSVMNGVAFAPTSTTTYMVTGIDVNGCTNTATTTVAVNAVPVVNLGPDVTQCGGTVILDAQNAGSTYLWSDATTSMTDTISTTGNYSVVVTNANGCMSSDTVMVTFDATLVVNLGQDITQCGGSVMLDAQNVGSTYLWNDATTFQINTVSMSGIYYVDVTTASGCTGSDTVMVTIYTPPTVTGSAAASIVCVNDASIALTGSPAGGTWTGPGVTGTMFNPSAAGVGSQSVGYSFTDANGCESSAIVTILVSACTGVVETSLINGVSVYPNPTSGAFTINVNANVGNMQIEMTDLQGKIVYSSMENNVNAGFAKQISIENLANGIYMLKLTTDSEQNTIKVTVQK